ncbi:MAG: DotU family type IV/VI secretion system protein [Isosphaeraceae bacterium]
MTPEFSDLVYRVISYALDLRDRVEDGSEPDLEHERSRLIDLLPANAGPGLQLDYAGDGKAFLGARYALSCWIDELFIVYSQWSDRWRPLILEQALFGTRVRAEKFWEQAEIVLRKPNAPRAMSPPGPDAVETFFLCIILGFRGTHRENPAKIREFVEEMRPQVARAADWPSPADAGVKTNVEPLVGRGSLLRVVAVYGGLSLVLLLVLLVLLRLLMV